MIALSKELDSRMIADSWELQRTTPRAVWTLLERGFRDAYEAARLQEKARALDAAKRAKTLRN